MRLLWTCCLILFGILTGKSFVNPALTLNPRTSVETLTDDMIRVPISVIKGMDNTKLHCSPYTMGAWIRPDFNIELDNQLDGIILSANNTASSHAFDGGVTLSIDYATRCLTVKGYSGLDIPENIGSTPLKNKQWQYVTLSFNPTTHKITAYLDGKQEISVGYTDYAWCESNSVENLFFMFGSVGYNGAIDDIHISSKVMTVEQIALCMDNKAEEASLSGWYTLDEIATGTTGEFVNNIASSQVNAQYVNFQIVSTKYYSYKKDTATESTPDLTTINENSQRQTTSTFNVLLPASSDFNGLKSLIFTLDDGTVLSQNETLSLEANTLIRINAEAEVGKQIRSISIKDEQVENGEAFKVTSDLNPADFVINTASVHSLNLSVPDILKYAVMADGNMLTEPYNIAEGAEVEIIIQNASLFNNISMKLNGTPITFAADGNIHFTMPQQDATFLFTGEETESVVIYFQLADGGEFSVNDGHSDICEGDHLVPGTTLTVKTTVYEGFYLLGIKVDGHIVEGNTFTVPANDFYLSADFRALEDYNKALTFKPNTTIACTQEDAIELYPETVGLSDIKSLENANFAAGVWLKQTQRVSDGNMILLVSTPMNYANTNPYLYFNTTAEGEIQFSGSFSKYNLQNVTLYPMGKILPLNEWHHLLFNVNMAQRRVELYFDGEFAAAIDNITVPQLSSQTAIKLYGGGLTFNGSFDELQLFNNTLTTEEITQLYKGDTSNLSSITALYDFQSTTNGKGTFANLADENPEYTAVYHLATGSVVDNGMSVQSHQEATADLSTITPQLQRLTYLHSHDATITAIAEGEGTIETYIAESSENRLLRQGEKIRNGYTLQIVAKPAGDNILKSIKINGIEHLPSRADNNFTVNHTVNGDTKIEASFASQTASINLPQTDEPETILDNSVYYTITGLRAAFPLSPGLYIKKQNDKVTKIIIK